MNELKRAQCSKYVNNLPYDDPARSKRAVEETSIIL
jgi:hypothetical protein